MKKFMYILRKWLFIPAILLFLVLLILLRVFGIIDESNMLIYAMLFAMVVYITLLLRPKKTVYAKNGEKWIKKYVYDSTSEEVKINKKDNSTTTYFTHHFTVKCTLKDNKYSYEYDLPKNGGYLKKDKDNKELSKKIPYKLYLKDLSKMEN